MTKVTPRADRVIDGTHGKLGADFPEGKVKKKKNKNEKFQVLLGRCQEFTDDIIRGERWRASAYVYAE